MRGKFKEVNMLIIDDVIKINREKPRTPKKERYDIYTPEPAEIFKGMLDCIEYACKRFNVSSITELSKEQYSHACAEYITALINHSTEFYGFITHNEKE